MAAQLAVNAIHVGEGNELQALVGQLERMATEAKEAGSEAAPSVRRHADLVRAARGVVAHPLGQRDELRAVLENATESEEAAAHAAETARTAKTR